MEQSNDKRELGVEDSHSANLKASSSEKQSSSGKTAPPAEASASSAAPRVVQASAASSRSRAPRRKASGESSKFELRCKLTTVEGQLDENPHFTQAEASLAAKREYNRRNAARARLRSKFLVEELNETCTALAKRATELTEENEKIRARIRELRALEEEELARSDRHCEKEEDLPKDSVAAPASTGVDVIRSIPQDGTTTTTRPPPPPPLQEQVGESATATSTQDINNVDPATLSMLHQMMQMQQTTANLNTSDVAQQQQQQNIGNLLQSSLAGLCAPQVSSTSLSVSSSTTTYQDPSSFQRASQPDPTNQFLAQILMQATSSDPSLAQSLLDGVLQQQQQQQQHAALSALLLQLQPQPPQANTIHPPDTNNQLMALLALLAQQQQQQMGNIPSPPE